MPHRNAEKAELKLCAIKQKIGEDVETYAKRVEEALAYLTMSRSPENQTDAFKAEDDKRATRAFENGIYDFGLRNKAIARGNQTLREAVDYTIQQELRQPSFKPRTESSVPPKFCNYCKIAGHVFSECRRRLAQNNGNNPGQSRFNNNNNSGTSRFNNNNNQGREVTCYKCNKKGHYANECPDASTQPRNTSSNSEQPGPSRTNLGISRPNSYQREYTNRDNQPRKMKFFQQPSSHFENNITSVEHLSKNM